ncbi:MAG: M1 family metallopeptidase [Flavobacteriales bacterium]|nr:M1 family metallopeptidase [Flavobacteriales bacterium]
MKKHLLLPACCAFACLVINGQNIQNNPGSNHGNKFEQLGTILPDPNSFRTASGAPGHEYWQQRADYDIQCRLDEINLMLEGEEVITYFNNSPDALDYLWLQLDENQHHPEAESNFFDSNRMAKPATTSSIERLDPKIMLNGYGVQILGVSDTKGNPLPYTINYTMMRIDLLEPLAPKSKISFRVKWKYKIPERMKIGGRGGYEMMDDGNALFTITQWFPRLCVYSDFQGWNNKQFTGRGEFALPFGNYRVRMTVPADHVVASTGTCVNIKEVLNKTELERWNKSQTATEPIEIITLEEAKAKEKNPVKDRFKTWEFKAENVRDFAWGSSRKFIWDAMGIENYGKRVMCMSFYPKEAYGLYRKYSTKVVAHTIRTYSKYTVPYQYPVAISVEASNGMEYPMICFNYGRTEPDGTYSERTKYGMISVIIHEVGHNFFPMIINSDERQWSWMDEGLNTFVQFLTEQEFDNNYPSSRGPAHKIVDYMRLPKDQLEPIMTNSENIINFGANAYGKPATALNILRETIMGRELFDFAFKQYAKRWAYKHPTPADFFRTMEDASGVDLDWFWRGWFFDIQPVDISLDSVKTYQLNRKDTLPVNIDTVLIKPNYRDKFIHITRLRNKQSGMKFLVDTDTSLRDFYYYYNPENDSSFTFVENYFENYEVLSEAEFKAYENKFIYELFLSNKGGLVMPLIIQWNYADGTSEIDRISAYVWRKNEQKVVKTFIKNKPVVSIQLDPFRETADIDEKNNYWPQTEIKSRIDLFKVKEKGMGQTPPNPMQRSKK